MGVTCSQCSASLTVNSLAAGSYGIIADYAGDTLDAPASSAVVTTRVGGSTTAISVIPVIGTVAFGKPLVLSASVTRRKQPE